jgi:hypothetical protein
MYFNVNDGVVKVLEILALHTNLQVLFVFSLLIIRLPVIVRELSALISILKKSY